MQVKGEVVEGMVRVRVVWAEFHLCQSVLTIGEKPLVVLSLREYFPGDKDLRLVLLSITNYQIKSSILGESKPR